MSNHIEFMPYVSLGHRQEKDKVIHGFNILIMLPKRGCTVLCREHNDTNPNNYEYHYEFKFKGDQRDGWHKPERETRSSFGSIFKKREFAHFFIPADEEITSGHHDHETNKKEIVPKGSTKGFTNYQLHVREVGGVKIGRGHNGTIHFPGGPG